MQLYDHSDASHCIICYCTMYMHMYWTGHGSHIINKKIFSIRNFTNMQFVTFLHWQMTIFFSSSFELLFQASTTWLNGAFSFSFILYFGIDWEISLSITLHEIALTALHTQSWSFSKLKMKEDFKRCCYIQLLKAFSCVSFLQICTQSGVKKHASNQLHKAYENDWKCRNRKKKLVNIRFSIQFFDESRFRNLPSISIRESSFAH